MSAAESTQSPAAVAIDTWPKVLGLSLTFGGLVISAALAFHGVAIKPVEARVDAVEIRTHQAERDRAEVLQRLATVEVILRRVDARMERQTGRR